jgi:crotonobetainyl-CoA:carnitine CoA-transferase CaiB-like acyl-CoA transferase
MDLTGEPDRPPVKLGTSLADIVTGLYAVQGILLAFLARHKTGRGQRIDVSLLDSMVSTLTYQAQIYLTTGRSPKRLGTRHPSIAPYESFETKDGFVNIGVTNQKQWTNFCQVLGFSDLATDPRFERMEARLANYNHLRPIIDRALAPLSRAEVIRRLGDVGIPVGPINTVGEILEDPQIHAREMIVKLTHPQYGPLRVLGIPVKLSDTPGDVSTAPPLFGEHNRDVLVKLGYTEEDIEAFGKSGVIAGKAL